MSKASIIKQAWRRGLRKGSQLEEEQEMGRCHAAGQAANQAVLDTYIHR